MKAGSVNKAFVFCCYRCMKQETIVSSTQYNAIEYLRRTENWSKKSTGWHCAGCKEEKK